MLRRPLGVIVPCLILLTTGAAVMTTGCGSSALAPVRGAQREAEANPTKQHIFLVSSDNNQINIYPTYSVGNVAPTSRIFGAQTQLNSPFAVGFDAAGEIFVENGSIVPSILVFAPGARGDVAPQRVIAGSNTMLENQCVCMAVDATGNVYIARFRAAPEIDVFAAGANGNVAPSYTIAGILTKLHLPQSPAIDADGDLWVADLKGLTMYAPGAHGNVAPARVIRGDETDLQIGGFQSGIAFDSSKDLFVVAFSRTTGRSEIAEFAPTANGDVAPVAVLSGANTMLDPSGISFDSKNQLYVANPLAIEVFAPGAEGNVPPIRTISGSMTQISTAAGLALH